MKMSGMLLLLGMLLAISFSGLSQSDAQEIRKPVTTGTLNTVFTACQEPRPAICYEVYIPVCAIKTTGKSTYVNDCKACADPMVKGFEKGECPSG